MIDYAEKGALFSVCRTYRYELIREWDYNKPTIVWCGLNPSTADENVDDPTIRREVDFSKRWGFGRYVKVNAYAFRATDPKVMLAATDPVGPQNLDIIVPRARAADMFVACWGGNITPAHAWRMRSMMVRERLTVYALKLTRSQQPGHPLYLASNTQPFKWIWTESHGL